MNGFHPAISTAIAYFAMPRPSLQAVASTFGISKQAAQKRVVLATAYLQAFPDDSRDDPRLGELTLALEKERQINALLRRQLVIYQTLLYLARAFKEMVQRFFPTMRLGRLAPIQKKYLLDMLGRFQLSGGSLKDYCQAIGKSPDTIRGWLLAFERFGMAGLADRISRPHHFANSIPVWLREQLVLLFIKFPQWTPYQYYKYIKGHPAYHWAISVPTIAKLKETHTIRTAEERARLKKSWAFAPGTEVWTMDFTCLFKTDRYKLQLLTVSDHRSRFWFETALLLETSTAAVIDHLEELFIKYGKPFMIKADNGPEFRMDCREDLAKFAIYLLNSPVYYAPFCGAHERSHRTLKEYIDAFAAHCNLTRLEAEIRAFRDDYNHRIPLVTLGMKTPAEIFYSDPDFVPVGAEVVTPYRKDGELRMKFTGRDGDPARIAIPQIDS